jgi:lysyl oxidase/Big-like domain-containing protein
MIATLVLALGGGGSLLGAGTGLGLSGAVYPDLTPELPTSQPVPAYMDTVTVPGKALYRFDSVIRNQGGALDLYGTGWQPNGGDPRMGAIRQVIWRGGTPDVAPDPSAPPPAGDANADVEDIGAGRGASFLYSYAAGHNHWHFQAAARYSLLAPGGARVSDKVGFCMFDSYGPDNGPTSYFPPGAGSGANTWCRPGDDRAGFVRMGISPGIGDYYWAQLADQWVDVTGLQPGTHTLRATVNPYDSIDEGGATANDTLQEPRIIPGAVADPKSVPLANGPTHIALSGSVVGAEVPAAGPSCSPTPPLGDTSCYVMGADAGRLTFRLATPPSNGTVTISTASGLGATATYTPAPGSSGPDGFSYVAIDTRGLTSPPATVTLGAGGPTAPPGGGAVPAGGRAAPAPGSGGAGTAAGAGSPATARQIVSAGGTPEGRVVVRGGRIRILKGSRMTVLAPRYGTRHSRLRLRVRYAHRLTHVRLVTRARRGSGHRMHTVASRRIGRVRATSIRLPRLRAGTWTLRVISIHGRTVQRTRPFEIHVARTLAAARRRALDQRSAP